MVDFNVNSIQERLTDHSQVAAQEAIKLQTNVIDESAASASNSNSVDTAEPIDNISAQDAVDQMNSIMKSLNQDFRFSQEGDGLAKQFIVKIFDGGGSVIRTIPSEEFLAMREAISNNIGIIFNQEG